MGYRLRVMLKRVGVGITEGNMGGGHNGADVNVLLLSFVDFKVIRYN